MDIISCDKQKLAIKMIATAKKARKNRIQLTLQGGLIVNSRRVLHAVPIDWRAPKFANFRVIAIYIYDNGFRERAIDARL